MPPRATNLHAVRVDDVEGSNHVEDKLDHLTEALIADTPRAVNEEDQISLGTFAHCERCNNTSTVQHHVSALSIVRLLGQTH